MNTPTIPPGQKRRLQAHFGFSGVPFRKNMPAHRMFDSTSQRELHHALHMWTEVRGLTLVTGATGVGKSITLRRFVAELDEARFRVFHLPHLPTTVTGLLRSLNRVLGLRMRTHPADLFDAAQHMLANHAQEHGPHPLLVLDDAEGVSVAALDVLRRLTAWKLDADDRFSILLSGTEDLLRTLRSPVLDSLRSRFTFVQALRGFNLEDTRNYIRFHLERAATDPKLFSDDAARRIFQASQGRPRQINQLALQGLIQAAVLGRDSVDGNLMASAIAAHPLYESTAGARR